MSSLMINWRFWGWFLQIERPSAWRYRWGRVSHLPGRPCPGEPWVAFYAGRRYAVLLGVLTAALLWWAL